MVNHQRAVPNSSISSPLDPCDGILNYIDRQGILNSYLSLGIDHHTVSNFLSSARDNSSDFPITSMPQNLANPLIRDPRTSPDPNSRIFSDYSWFCQWCANISSFAWKFIFPQPFTDRSEPRSLSSFPNFHCRSWYFPRYYQSVSPKWKYR